MSKKQKQTKSITVSSPTTKQAPKQEKPVNETLSAKSVALLSFVIVAVAFLLYSNTFQHRFVLDDHGIIKNNKITKSPVSWDNTVTIFSTPHRKGDFSDLENSLYRPFTKLLFNIEWNLFHANQDSYSAAHKFHIVNVLLYAITCLLIFWVLYEVFGKKWMLPFFITLLFTVHPIHTEVVANIKSSDEILSLLGIMIALRCIQLYAAGQKKFYIALAALGFLMGSYSKESTVVAVGLFPVFIFLFTSLSHKQNALISGIMLACSGLFLWSRHNALSGYPPPGPLSAMDNYLVLCENGASRFASAVNTLGHYLKTFLVPHPLSCDYSFATFRPVDFSHMGFLISFIVLIALLVYGFLQWKKGNKVFAFGVWWFFVTMSITSNVFFLIGTSFGERLLFVPSLGLSILLVMLPALFLKVKNTHSILNDLKTNSVLTLFVIIVSVAYAFKTITRNPDWKSDYKLFSRDIEYFPDATHLLFYMGNHLSGNERKEVLTDEMTQLGFNTQQINDSAKKESEKSIYYFNRSLSLFPALPSDGYNQLGKAYFNMGNLDSAFKYYQKAYKEDSTNGIFINNIGTVYYIEALH
jgi:Tetratricopeptide repeat.